MGATTTDLELVEGLRRGDPAALEALMQRYAPRVWRLVHGITRSSSDAEEVVQDVFLGLVRSIAGFEGRARLGTWIYRIATNAALNKRRGRRFQVEVSLDAELPRFRADGHREGARAWVVADWSATPEAELLSRERRAALTDAIAALPERHRAVLILRDVEELANGEVAEILGESVASVKSRLHRARMALRERMTRVMMAPPARAAVP
ncbi:MAG: hypothetical protein A3E31_07425 [Candidatus Rokubacteria bacterium RIFCSPHIGHO2_12_FULL_73_22]|nr:MAG: hypothetical protein A3D33_16055 [Candidatus Rokubacteria bacterium RIFCSPHIGHO2_02_FULL_73_26]OGL00991.1 MAG: hypothetical protein A3E31_07425 [Candidatus Rokubacteria bacterium RIFCSPHIGHO2_12_FULL_73_22]OGL10775.1 MAG: hypothetical protein A3I14_06155 [Candidatus Rokubacteria bacterium RIFCSPLOWO2_02_FULL_73_56]OGL25466.1 MAG: hypothetical protein A3G44_06690 [Candidatus Rokubacteria bacterium RIFCSPLOWO2_12_FULL_73_47]